MFKKLLPKQYERSIYHIDLDVLKERGIKGIITDLDNTLVEWDRAECTPEVRDWFSKLQENDIQMMIVSNNNEKRVATFSDPEEVVYIHSAKKPMRRAFQEACEAMGLAKEEVVVIGDQIFTDVLGGNRAGLHTILVVPVSSSDGMVTKFNRFMERFVLRRMKKLGMISWEEK